MLLNDLKNNGFVVIKGSFGKKDFIGLNIISKKLHKLYLENKNYSFLDNFYFKHRPDQGVLYDIYQRYPEFRFLLSNSFVNNFISKYYQHKPFVLYENSLVYKPPGKSNKESCFRL